jgi:hypothetical protein
VLAGPIGGVGLTYRQSNCAFYVGRTNQPSGAEWPPFSIHPWLNADAERMPKDNNNHTYEDCEPSTLFREFAAECMELAQTAPTPKKSSLYMKMVSELFKKTSPPTRISSSLTI